MQERINDASLRVARAGAICANIEKTTGPNQ
jgi:hypothetical protein